MNWSEFFSLQSEPTSSLAILAPTGVLGLVLILLALIINPLTKNSKKSIRKTVSKARPGMIWLGLGFLLITWMRSEGVPFLSWPPLAPLLAVGFGYWLYRIMSYYNAIDKRITRAQERRKNSADNS